MLAQLGNYLKSNKLKNYNNGSKTFAFEMHRIHTSALEWAFLKCKIEPICLTCSLSTLFPCASNAAIRTPLNLNYYIYVTQFTPKVFRISSGFFLLHFLFRVIKIWCLVLSGENESGQHQRTFNYLLLLVFNYLVVVKACLWVYLLL